MFWRVREGIVRAFNDHLFSFTSFFFSLLFLFYFLLHIYYSNVRGIIAGGVGLVFGDLANDMSDQSVLPTIRLGLDFACALTKLEFLLTLPDPLFACSFY